MAFTFNASRRVLAGVEGPARAGIMAICGCVPLLTDGGQLGFRLAPNFRRVYPRTPSTLLPSGEYGVLDLRTVVPHAIMPCVWYEED